MAGLDGEVAWHAANAGDPEPPRRAWPPPSSGSGRSTSSSTTPPPTPTSGRSIDIDLARAEKTVQVNLQAVLVWTQCAWRASMARARRLGHQRVVGRRPVGRAGHRLVQRDQGRRRPPDPPAGRRARPGGAGQRAGPGPGADRLRPGPVGAAGRRRGGAAAPASGWASPTTSPQAALFLASEAASWITGHVLVVDGGALAMPSGGV